METTPEVDRNAVLEKLEFRQEKKNVEGSEVWDSEVKELALARLQQQTESLETDGFKTTKIARHAPCA